jgi:hypothetical protein
MNPGYEAVCKSLDGLATAVKNGWNSEQTFSEVWGWNCPAMTRHDAANIATRLADDIRRANADTIDEELAKVVPDLPRRIQLVQAGMVPQFWGGNNGAAIAAYINTLSAIRQSLMPLLGWESFPDSKLMPISLGRKLRSIQAGIDQLVPNKEALSAQIATIQSAHEAAESLPVDMQSLIDARNRVEKLAGEANASTATIEKNAKVSETRLQEIASRDSEAARLVSQCEEAYRITTTKGLAGAFDQRASRLARSMWTWVSAIGNGIGARDSCCC